MPQQPAADYDLIVFVSVNAVAHGAHLISKGPRTRIAAIGKATAAALAAQTSLPPISFPKPASTAKPCSRIRICTLASGARVLIVRGAGGRELLQETFVARGLIVETREVYRRVRPQIDDAARDAELEARWPTKVSTWSPRPASRLCIT